VVTGNGPLNLQLAHEMRRAGVGEVTVVEAARPPWQRPLAGLAMAAADPWTAAMGIAILVRLRRADVPILWSSAVRQVETGGVHGLRAHVACASGRAGRTVECDAVLAGGGFMSSHELARLLGCACKPVDRGVVTLEVERGDDGTTSVPDIFVVGEAGRFSGAHVAMAEGVLAGAAAASRLGHPVNAPAKARAALLRGRRFQAALWRSFAAPSSRLDGLEPETQICRCECLTLTALRSAVRDHGITDVASLKRLTRAGMGRCQGRYCGTDLHELVGGELPSSEADFFAPQAPLRPIRLCAIAAEKPEWRGHRRTALPHRNTVAAEPFAGTLSCATVVVGAGIVGLATAYFLASGGEDVVVLEQCAANSGASGGNAGSLHAQLLSFDFDEAGPLKMTPALATLPLQKASIGLWQQLERTLQRNFEIKVTGGLMVAENDADLRRLEQKAAAERSQGINCEVIDAVALRNLEPALAERFVGAAFCPLEGKINPLLATMGLAEAARAHGVRIHGGCEVSGIEPRRGAFHLTTSRGPVVAGRIVNASGPFARAIGALVGVDLPVFTAPLQMIVTEAVAPIVTRLVAHACRHLTLKQAANGNVLIGGGWPAGLDPIHAHPRPSRESLEGNAAVALHVVPALADVHIIRSWGAPNIDIDGAPIIGEHPAVPGFFTAVGANGYTLGPIFGQILADLITHGGTDFDIRPFAVERFTSG
jgi:glycine/D-amino acid oxidase-like deaminating enzyme